MTSPLDGKRILIVGAAGGIGEALSELLMRHNAALLLNDLGTDRHGAGTSMQPVLDLAERLRAIDRNATIATHHLDAALPGAAEELWALAEEELGGLDGVVWAAGHRAERGVLKLGEKELSRALEVHLQGPMRLAKCVAQKWVDARQGGSIVVLGSPSSFFGAARQSHEAAASAGLAAFVRSAALELRRHGIRVNALMPTARTRLTDDLPLFQKVAEGSMSPSHVAPVVAYLLSNFAKDASGEVLGVAGSRFYSFQSRETTGAFSEGRPFEISEIADVWSEAMRA